MIRVFVGIKNTFKGIWFKKQNCPGTLMFLINADFPKKCFFFRLTKGMGNWQVVWKSLGFNGYG